MDESSKGRVEHNTRIHVLIGAILVVGCGSPVFPRELFTVEAADADYPLMMSEAPSNSGGRALQAESGTHAAQSQSTYSTGDTTVTIQRSESSQSELSASMKLAAHVRRSDRFVQFEKAVFSASDFSTYGASSADRILSIEATAHK